MARVVDISGSVRSGILRNRHIIFIIIFVFQVVVSNYLAFLLRFDFLLSELYLYVFTLYLPLLIFVRLLSYLIFGLHRGVWRYAGIKDLSNIILSVTVGSIFFVMVVRIIFGDTSYPRSVYFIDWLLLIILSGGGRMAVRVFREYVYAESKGKAVLLIGAGDAGEMIVRDMRSNPDNPYNPVGFIDDDKFKKGLSIHGVPIYGPRDIISQAIKDTDPDEILIAIPSASHSTINEIFESCKQFNLPVKTLPGLSDILDGKVTVSQIRPLSLENLLQREPIRTDIRSVKDYLKDKKVLVTGAGGSIGSELCRQIFKYGPSSLIMLDRYENGLFDIDMELNRNKRENATSVKTSADMVIHPIVGDLRDKGALSMMFGEHSPQIVFHAAAHKHVPLMEANPIEAIKNNVFGTRNLIDIVKKNNVESFVMVSTDKAVNPANVMGATKRIAELMTITSNEGSVTKFKTVRFGNVLGSNGSVVNIFQEQLERGGPLTVTDPEIKRYFMLIPEAVQLVLIASATGDGGDVYVLDMGEQISIKEMAENLIALSGFIPYEDIEIDYTGLRPGEKLYEELFDDTEKIEGTSHSKLKRAVPVELPTREELEEHLGALDKAISNGQMKDIDKVLREMVRSYKR
ncbi:MAG: polysaccharide biosynthesis protein [Nitrospirota bacterium]|nr:MAG: polysaccharide biosynthesis protein [Nitrospirota bacterium]